MLGSVTCVRRAASAAAFRTRWFPSSAPPCLPLRLALPPAGTSRTLWHASRPSALSPSLRVVGPRRLLSSSEAGSRSKLAVHDGTAAKSGYPRLEEAVMTKLHLEDRYRFRSGLLTLVTCIGAFIYAKWEDTKTLLAGETADIASRSLSDREIQEQASVFAKAVVREVLSDAEVYSQARQFVFQLLEDPSTTKSLTALVLSVLQSPESLKQVQKLLIDLIHDPVTQQQLVQLLVIAIQDKATVNAVLQLLKSLVADPDTQAAVMVLLQALLADPSFRAAATDAGSEVVHGVLNDRDVEVHAKQWVQSMLTDDDVQKHGGDALWGAVTYSLTPSFLRRSKSMAPAVKIEQPPGSSPAPAPAPAPSPAPSPPTPPPVDAEAAAARVDDHSSATDHAELVAPPSTPFVYTDEGSDGASSSEATGHDNDH